MPKKILALSILLSVLSVFSLEPALARDPYPAQRERTKFIVAPKSANADVDNPTDPQTMLRTNGIRSDIISFACFNPQESDGSKKYKFLTDPNIYSLEKATAACQQFNPPYTQIKPPYLKNNKNSPECLGKTYDANCYSYPIGNFLGRHPNAAKGGSLWVTPVVYESYGGPLNACGPNKNERCDCQFVPKGPKETWLQITRVVNGITERCVAPPYSTSGPWWDWLIGEIDRVRNNTDLSNITTAGVFFGIDGEGRPFKSGQGWTPDPGFSTQYVPKVIEEIKRRYPNKIIRAHFTRDLDFFLENQIDFHWESLSSDGTQEYLYKGLAPMGYDQIYQNHFFITNTLGLNPDWPPYYQSLLNALAKHTDGITGFVDIMDSLYQDGRGDFIKFAGSYIGKNINDTPGVWNYLRETVNPKESGNTSGKYGDYMFYLYRPEDLENNKTVPVSASELPPATSQQLYNYKLPLRRHGYPDVTQYIGRKNTPGSRYISFDVDDGYRYAGIQNSSFDIKIIYLDTRTDSFKFQYKNSQNNWQEKIITKTNTNLWQETTFNITDAYFNNNASEGANAQNFPTDFRLETNGTTIHLVEAVGRGNLSYRNRPKAQVSCQLVRNETDNPQDGLYSVGLNQNIKVIARLKDQNNNPLPNERVMITVNSEWNLAKSISTNQDGIAVHAISTTNRSNSSGFLGTESGRSDKPSYYSVQVYYPGSQNFQPSRNDCLLLLTGSQNPDDPKNTRIKITAVDTSQISQTGKARVSYQVIDKPGNVILNKTEDIGKAKTFYSQDPSAQTISLSYTSRDYHASSNNFTIAGIGGFSPEPSYPSNPPDLPSFSLQKGDNFFTVQSAFAASALPSQCQNASFKQNGLRKVFIKNYSPQIQIPQGVKLSLSCTT